MSLSDGVPFTTKDRVRALRGDASPPERILWSRLRSRRLKNLKFRRQCPVGGYVADFLCEEARLLIELDGERHADQREHDAARDAFLRERGYVVLRVSVSEFMANEHAVLEHIARTAVRSIAARQKPD